MRTPCNARSATCAWLLAAATLAAQSAIGQTPAKPFSDEKKAMLELGKQHETAWDLYQRFKAEANGGAPLSPADVPDWSGVWVRSGNLFFWDQDQGELPTAKLTPEYERRLNDKLARIKQDIEYDPLSAGEPAGMPRWMTEPFLRDFAVTPQQTWLLNEMANEVRRIYTDGREHTPREDAYPLWLGDSIGFWDGDRLIIHTEQMRDGQYQRPQPHYSDQVETVEIWRKTDDRTIEVDVWVYDPPALLEPWYTQHTYKQLTNDDKALRVRYWHFSENPNNDVFQTEDGSSQFSDFTFTDRDDN
jgi:hypothetical protein